MLSLQLPEDGEMNTSDENMDWGPLQKAAMNEFDYIY